MSTAAEKLSRDARATGEAVDRGLVEAHDANIQKATKAANDAVASVGKNVNAVPPGVRAAADAAARLSPPGRPRPPTVHKQPTPPGENLEPGHGLDKGNEAGSEASPNMPPAMSLAQQKLREQDMKAQGADMDRKKAQLEGPAGEKAARAQREADYAADKAAAEGRNANISPKGAAESKESPKAPAPMSLAQQKLREQDKSSREATQKATGEAQMPYGNAAAAMGATDAGQTLQQQQQLGWAGSPPGGLSRGMEAARAPLPRKDASPPGGGSPEADKKISPTAAARSSGAARPSGELLNDEARSGAQVQTEAWNARTSAAADRSAVSASPGHRHHHHREHRADAVSTSFTGGGVAERPSGVPEQVVEKVVTKTTTTTLLPPTPSKKDSAAANLCTLTDLDDMRKRVLDAAARTKETTTEETVIQPAAHAELCVRLGRTTLDCSLSEHRCKLESGIRAIQELADRVRGIETAREDAAAAREGEVRDAERRMDENLEALRARVASEVTTLLRRVEQGELAAADCSADVQRLIERVEEGTRTQTRLDRMVQELPPLAAIEALVSRAERAAIDANKTLLGASDTAERLSRGTPNMMVALNALGAATSPSQEQPTNGKTDADAAAAMSRIADLRARIAAMMSTFSTLDVRLETLDDRGRADQEALGTLSARITDVEGDVKSRYDRIVQDVAGEQARADETRDIIRQCTTALADARQRQEDSLAAVRDGCTRLERVMQEARSAQIADQDNTRTAAAAERRSEELVSGALDAWTARMAALTKQMERDSAAQWDVLTSLARASAAANGRHRVTAEVPRGYVETKTVLEEQEVVTQTRPSRESRHSPGADRNGPAAFTAVNAHGNTTMPKIEEVA